ncbi:unnamed protein product [Cuscuta europaea]|uniref:Uncharacterized protein n=1 Tax=Cuscuta europaea TaxID=41803 RepID=A0A9P0Z603_CUSEU|nr:unnamed protein product [Cuscuta europaea]
MKTNGSNQQVIGGQHEAKEESPGEKYVGREELHEIRIGQISIDNGGSIRVVPMIRPPPEPPPWVVRGARVRDSFRISYYYFVIWFLIIVLVVRSISLFGMLASFNFVKTLEPRTGDGELSLLVIGSSKLNLGSANLGASLEVADSKSGSSADGRLCVSLSVCTLLTFFLINISHPLLKKHLLSCILNTLVNLNESKVQGF